MEVVRFLCQKMVQNKVKDKRSMNRALMAMVGHPETVELLLDSGVDVNTRDHLGRTALILAATSGS